MILASAEEVVHAYLTAAGEVQNDDQAQPWWAVIGKRVDEPQDAVFIYGPAGVSDGRARDDYVVHQGIQILVVGFPYTAARQKIWSILEVLKAVKMTPVTVDPGTDAEEQVVFQGFHLTSAPAHLGQQEDSQREQFSLNGTVTILAPES